MKKTFLIAGMSAVVALGAAAGAALAQAQTPARPAAPAAGAPAPGMGPGMGMGMNRGGRGGMGMDRGGRGGRGGFGQRGGRRGPTLEQLQQRNTQLFAQLDANKDGRVTQAEYTGYIERQRAERQRQAFQRFSGGSDSVTLDQLNARAAQRFNQRPGAQGAPGARPAPAQPPAARPAPAR